MKWALVRAVKRDFFFSQVGCHDLSILLASWFPDGARREGKKQHGITWSAQD